MLVVTRFEDDGIRIGDDVLIKMLNFEKNDDGYWYIRVGIMAPQSKRILREELWNENQILAVGKKEDGNANN